MHFHSPTKSYSLMDCMMVMRHSGWQGIEGEGTEYRVYIDGDTTALYTLILILQIILNITAAAIAMKIVPADKTHCRFGTTEVATTLQHGGAV